MSVCVCVSEREEEEPGLLRSVITGCRLRSVIFRSPPSVRVADLLRTCPGIYLILVKLTAKAEALLSWCPLETPRPRLDFTATFGDLVGVWEIMETWFLKLGLSLSVLLVALPGLLGAGTPTNNSTQPFTAGINYSTAADELSDTENNATSASSSSESLSPSQRNILLSLSAETHTAAAGFFGKSRHCGGASATLGLPPLSPVIVS